MDYKNQFPVLNNVTYLNTAYAGVLSAEILKWRNQHDIDFMQKGSQFRVSALAGFDALRIDLAIAFGAVTENTYLVPNFSFGLNTILNGLDKNHRFLLLKEDYPSVNYPIKSLGFANLELAITADVEQQIEESIKKFKPTVFAFSVVQYINGYRLDPNFIIKLKRDYLICC